MSDPDQGSREGSQFGPYRLLRVLGRGGMGEVYEAEDTVKGRVVALKLMSKSVSRDPVFRKRMIREARTAGRLHEPHVVPVHDFGEIDGQLYLDMRMIDGTDLRAILTRYGPLTPPRAVAVVRQIAAALDAAHAAGVVHRDVKPENILLTDADFAYLVDFGIASATSDERLTQMGSAVGTWRYMAPERFISDHVTDRADIYALACVLHECLTGAPPYRADSAGVLINAHLNLPIPKPSRSRAGIPAAFDEVVARGMAKDPAERWASAGELAAAAHEALTARDKDRAEAILERSTEATLPAIGDWSPTLVPQRPASAPAAPPTPPSYFGSDRSPPIGPRAQLPPGPPPPGGAGPLPSKPGRPRNRTRWVLGAVAVVAVVVLGALGVWLGTRTHTHTGTAATPTSSEPATVTVTTSNSTAEVARLLRFAPAGLQCNPEGAVLGALVSVSCDPAPPFSSLEYSLYANADALRVAFQQTIRKDVVTPCPGAKVGPDHWVHASTGDKVIGSRACGTYQNTPAMVWTVDSWLVLAQVQGNNLNAIYGWWKNNATPSPR
jgi:serine/threonine protein kinase